jgi:hypothetical protein
MAVSASGTIGANPNGSVYGPPLPVVWGTAKVTRKVLWVGSRCASPAGVSGIFYYTGWGDGDWKSGGYGAPTVLGFALGATEALTLYYGQDKRALDGLTVTAGVNAAKTLRRILADPACNNPPWLGTAGEIVLAPTTSPSFLTGAAVGMQWRGISQIRTAALGLGSDGKVPDIALELVGRCAVSGTGARDAHPIDVIRDILTDSNVGLGIPSADVITDVGPNGLASSSARRYVDCMTSWRVSRCLDTFTSASQLLQELLEACNCELVYSEGKIKVWPLGDAVIVASLSYVPAQWNDSSKLWEPVLLDADELERDALETEQTPQSETFNVLPITYRDRTKDYEDTTINVDDAADVAARGPCIAGTYSNAWITGGTHATQIAQIRVAKMLRRRNLFRRVRVGPRWLALEPGDIVQISDGKAINHCARIEKTDEDDQGKIEIEAREWSTAATHPIDYTPQGSEGGRPLPETDQAVEVYTWANEGSTSQDTAANPTTDNLYPNPTGEVSPPTVYGPAALDKPEWADRIQVGSGDYAGTWRRRLVSANPPPHNVANNGEAFGAASTIQKQDSIPHLVRCVPGEVFYFEANAELSVKANSGTRAAIYATFLDKDGAYLSGTVYTETGNTTWTKLSVTTAAAPAGACYVAFVYRVDCTTSLTMGETADFDGLLAKRVTQGPHLSSGLWPAVAACGITLSAPTLQSGSLNVSGIATQTLTELAGQYGIVVSFTQSLASGLRPTVELSGSASFGARAQVCGTATSGGRVTALHIALMDASGAVQDARTYGAGTSLSIAVFAQADF